MSEKFKECLGQAGESWGRKEARDTGQYVVSYGLKGRSSRLLLRTRVTVDKLPRLKTRDFEYFQYNKCLKSHSV